MSNDPVAPRRWMDEGDSPESRAVRRFAEGLPSEDVLLPAARRVELRLREGRPRRVRPLAVGIGLATAAAAVGFVLLPSLPRPAEPERAVPPAHAAQAAAPSGWRLWSAPAGLPAGELAYATPFETGPAGGAVLRLAREAAVLVGPATRVTAEPSAGAVLELHSGEVLAKVAKRRAEAPFVIRTAQFAVRVVGTVFCVRAEAGRTQVEVAEGAVEVTGLGMTRRVAAGHRWDSLRPDAMAEWSGADPASQALLEDALVSAEPWAPWHVESPGPALLAPPKRVAAIRETRPEPAPQARPDPAPPAAKPGYEEAVALARQGRHEEAEALFATVVAEEMPHRDLALYELAQLEEGRHDPAALAHYELYRRDYAKGPLLQEVELSIIEVLLKAREDARAADEIARFLAAHPESERAPELHLVRGDLARQREDCEAALSDYRSVSPTSAQADDARYFAAWCEARLGRAAEAKAALVEYLERFPSGRHASQAKQALAGR